MVRYSSQSFSFPETVTYSLECGGESFRMCHDRTLTYEEWFSHVKKVTKANKLAKIMTTGSSQNNVVVTDCRTIQDGETLNVVLN